MLFVPFFCICTLQSTQFIRLLYSESIHRALQSTHVIFNFVKERVVVTQKMKLIRSVKATKGLKLTSKRLPSVMQMRELSEETITTLQLVKKMICRGYFFSLWGFDHSRVHFRPFKNL